MRDIFFKTLFKQALKDKNIILITSDTGAIYHDQFRKKLKNQYINVGVAEQNMIGIAAGLSLSGKKVYVYGITPFVTLRCYEQIRVDLCFMNLPVTIVGIGAGFDYSTLGFTHHGIEDIAVMRVLPNISIYSPSDDLIAEILAKKSHYKSGPTYIRLDRTGKPLVYKSKKNIEFFKGFSLLKKGKDVCIVATGRMVCNAIEISNNLSKNDLDIGVVDLFRIKPINRKGMWNLLKKYKYVITLEEHCQEGGIKSVIAEIFASKSKAPLVKSFNVSGEICRRYGRREYLQSLYGVDVPGVTQTIVRYLGKNKQKSVND